MEDRSLAGALLVDKPSGPTSHDVVAVVRRALKTPRVGHTGTLDPLATGLLVVLVGPATRLARFVAADEKEYLADVRLGVSTPTYDAASVADGVRWTMGVGRWPMRAEVDAVLARFRGSFLQMPPAFSAKKVDGVAAYEKARKQQAVNLQPVPVTVRELELLDPSPLAPRPSPIEQPDLLPLRVAASAGFYVRSLAHDIGQALGCGAHLEALRRTRVGRFRVEDALTLDRLTSPASAPLIDPAALLGEMPSVTLTEAGLRRAEHGNVVAPEHTRDGATHFSPHMAGGPVFARLMDAERRLLGVAERRGDGLLHPVVILR